MKVRKMFNFGGKVTYLNTCTMFVPFPVWYWFVYYLNERLSIFVPGDTWSWFSGNRTFKQGLTMFTGLDLYMIRIYGIYYILCENKNQMPFIFTYHFGWNSFDGKESRISSSSSISSPGANWAFMLISNIFRFRLVMLTIITKKNKPIIFCFVFKV